MAENQQLGELHLWRFLLDYQPVTIVDIIEILLAQSWSCWEGNESKLKRHGVRSSPCERANPSSAKKSQFWRAMTQPLESYFLFLGHQAKNNHISLNLALKKLDLFFFVTNPLNHTGLWIKPTLDFVASMSLKLSQ